MRDSDSNKLRPIDAFVKYFLDVKPYHTKLLEVVERYKFAEEINVNVSDSLFTKISYRNTPLCKAVGFGLIFDECGFSSDNCCDLFQCLGGYGVIWDNSDLVAQHDIVSVDAAADEIIFAGDHSFDRRLEILQVNADSVVLRGIHTEEFLSHRLFLIAPFNVRNILSATQNVITIAGDVANELNAKKEIRVNGTQGRDGMYGVSNAVYDPDEGITSITVAGAANFNVDVTGAYIETETQARNQGFYPVDRAEVVNGNTYVYTRPGHGFATQTTSDNGSLQLRTGFTAPRHVWLLDNNGAEREYRIAETYYNVTTGNTHVVLADQLFEGETYTQIRLYGYITNAGFDADELCDRPKPTNVHATLGEKLVLRVVIKSVPEPSPTPSPTPSPSPSPTPEEPEVEGLWHVLVTYD